MGRNHIRFVLLAVLAMLLFVLTNLQAQSLATNSAPPIPATNTNAPTRPISDAQFKKILADAQANGKDHTIVSEVTTAFGITHNGETLTMRHDPFLDDNKDRHSLIIPNNGNYIIAKSTIQNAHDYYVDKNLMLISALIIDPKNEITIIPNKDAQAGLDAELKFFAGIADQL
jgi:hypothetical protein